MRNYAGMAINNMPRFAVEAMVWHDIGPALPYPETGR